MRLSASDPPAFETPGNASSRPPEVGSRPASWPDRWAVLGVCIFLVVMVWEVFGQTLGFGFVNYDDNVYVYENPVVQKGLTLQGIIWAFTHVYAFNWHPLTWLSHMLDCQLYGLHAGGHHLTNLLLHTAKAILLFLVLRRMTGFLWRSAFVAAVFAIHPLRVESVAWVAERKDVLSGLFFMLTLGAYVRYACRPWSPSRYGLVMLSFALGLICKPMLVTLPFVLLLLDYWPLNRLQTHTGTEPVFQLAGRRISRRLIFEKLPLLGLTVASCVITIFAQTGVIQPLEDLPLSLRVENALISYVAYLGQIFWPSGLAVLYPFTAKGVGGASVVLSLVVLAGISMGAFVLRRRCPYFLTGWLWYLGMLVPVIGIVQVGLQARADRYTYLPQIGLYVLLAWGVADFSVRLRHRQWVLGSLSTVILAALIGCARAQTAYWRNSESLWTHTLACTSDNFVGHNSLGTALLQQGKVDEAITQYQKALQINPHYAEAHYNLGSALFHEGELDQAIAQYQTALQIKPDFAEAHNNLGIALFQNGEEDEAIAHFQKALQINPDFAEARNDLGNALLQEDKADEAIAQFQKALQINPDYAEAHNNLGNALLQKGQVDEAIAHYQTALQINPNNPNICNNLGNALLQKGNVDEAIAYFQNALQIYPDYAEAHNNLGNALLQEDKVDEAIAQCQMALQINPDYAEAHNNLGNALLQKGQVDEAIAQCQKALQIKPDYADAHGNLGNALLEKGRLPEAIKHFQQALAIRPDDPKVEMDLGNAWSRQGQFEQAIAHYQTAIQLQPNNPAFLNNLAWLLATCPEARFRNGQQAVQLAERACQLTDYKKPQLIGTLAAAYAEAGRFEDAVTASEKAHDLALALGQQTLARKNEELLQLFKNHQPYRE